MKGVGAILVSASAAGTEDRQICADLKILAEQIKAAKLVDVTRISVNISSDEENLIYYYFSGTGIEQTSAAILETLTHWCGQLPTFFAKPLEVIRLSPLVEIRGAAHGAEAPAHYVVHTDVEVAAEADFNEWYMTEHLPGLAAVPGTVTARRFLNLDKGPRYYACYELVAAEVLACPEWLAVRATAWSSRVRPLFRNTRRHMFRHLCDITLEQ